MGMGLLLGAGIVALFAAFPMAIVGAMMLMVGVKLFAFARELRFDRSLVSVGATVAGSVVLNMAAGFAAGLVLHYILLGRPEGNDDAE